MKAVDAEVTSVRPKEFLGLALVIAACAVALVLVATRKPLWYDELFSFYVVRLETPGTVLRALLDGADNGPPLDYWFRHAFVTTFGENALALRLPSILSFLVALAAIWAFARTHVSALAATAAVALLPSTMALFYGTQGRFYGPLLALMPLTLLAWRATARSPRSVPRLAILYLILTAGPFVHYYGVLNYVPIAVAQAVVSFRERHFPWSVATVVLLSLVTLPLLIPFAANALEMREYFWASNFGLRSPLYVFRYLLGPTLWPVILLCLLGAAAFLQPRAATRSSVPREDLAATAALLATPVTLFLLAVLWTNALTQRYAIVTTIGACLAVGYAVDSIAHRSRSLAWILVLAVAAGGGVSLFRAVETADDASYPPSVLTAIGESAVPVAVDSPTSFLELFHQLGEPEHSPLIYLVDRAASQRALGFDNDEIALPKLRSVTPLVTEALDVFLEHETQFQVLAGPGRRYWLLAELTRRGKHLTATQTLGDYQFYTVTHSPRSTDES